MPISLIVGAPPVSSPSDKINCVETFYAKITNAQHYVIETNGNADLLVNIFGPFTNDEMPVPNFSKHQLKFQGGHFAGKKLEKGHYLIHVSQQKKGKYSICVIPWSLKHWISYLFS